ncbi:MAG: argininosuccinate lyase [Coriobacteriales bacterium]|jgi:argininosuccinate lyase|nr:argininosuccinate lyase [Coriobacteriales bacterium]
MPTTDHDSSSRDGAGTQPGAFSRQPGAGTQPGAFSRQPPAALWGGRFEGEVSEAMLAFGASLPVDRRLWRWDIQGSQAHAHMLARQGIIAPEDAAAIDEGLASIARDLASGDHGFYDLADEDIHMSIERELTRRIGPAGGRLHTARSRNDQVATDTRLFCRAHAAGLATEVNRLRGVLIGLANDHLGVIMPGYTHLQKAQPVLFSHHMLAYQWMLARDFTRLLAACRAADVMPLGSAALAGTTYPLDRASVATELGFSQTSPNSLDAVSDRDFVCDLLYACSLAMVHLSRLSEEIILWSSEEFGFVTLDDAFSTGSSIMPQKKNPDFAELTRGKAGRVVGGLMGMLMTLKGLPLAYNKDLQEDKEGVFDAVDTLSMCLTAMSGMLATMRVNSAAMLAGAQGGFMAATDLADHLAARGVPFREAHEVVGRVVLDCERTGRTLQELGAEDLRAFDARFGDDAPLACDISEVVARRTTVGGTAPACVAEQIGLAREQLAADSDAATALIRP